MNETNKLTGYRRRFPRCKIYHSASRLPLTFDPQFDFESLVRLVASDSSAIVPVVSFKELPRSDWKHLPDIVTSGFHGRANVVICTHLDQISQGNMEVHRDIVTKIFWPRDVMNTNSVLPCSSLMGLSARDLLDKSCSSKPPFEEIWKRDTVGYHVRGSLLTKYASAERPQCAAKILGVGDPKPVYAQLDDQTWRNKLDTELRASGLPGAIQELTTEMVDRARIKALLSEADTVTKHVKELRSVQGCVPLLYSQSSFTLLFADENFSRQGEPRTTTMPLNWVIIKLVDNSWLSWRPGRARRISKSRKTASCSNGHPH